MNHRLFQFATVAMIATGMAFAQTPAGRPGRAQAKAGLAQGQIRRRIMQNLNLTDSQKQQAKAIFEQAKSSVQAQQQQLQQNREALRAAVKANDSARIQQLSSEQGALRGQVMAARADAQAKFMALLTPEQRDKAQQMRQRIQQRANRRQG